MKKIVFAFLAIVSVATGCATVQSIIKSTFPYTASLTIPASVKADAKSSAISAASSFDEVFGNQSGTNYIKDVRISSAKLTASSPANKSLGIFKSVRLYISGEEGKEILVASRTDVQANIGPNLALDIDNSNLLDQYVKGKGLKVRMEYVLRESPDVDVSVRASLSFISSPSPK